MPQHEWMVVSGAAQVPVLCFIVDAALALKLDVLSLWDHHVHLCRFEASAEFSNEVKPSSLDFVLLERENFISDTRYLTKPNPTNVLAQLVSPNRTTSNKNPTK
jgi:hypothetical protein